MEIKELIGEIVPGLQKAIIGEIKTVLMNGVKDELAELLTEKLLSDEKGSFKNRILKEVADRKKIDETIRDLEKQIEDKDVELASRVGEINNINNKKMIKKIIQELEIVPHNMDILEQMIDTSGDVKEENLKKQINAFVESYPFMFKASQPTVQGYGDVSNIFTQASSSANPTSTTNTPYNNGVEMAQQIKNLYGGFDK